MSYRHVIFVILHPQTQILCFFVKPDYFPKTIPG